MLIMTIPRQIHFVKSQVYLARDDTVFVAGVGIFWFVDLGPKSGQNFGKLIRLHPHPDFLDWPGIVLLACHEYSEAPDARVMCHFAPMRGHIRWVIVDYLPDQQFDLDQWPADNN